jgi:hypothetical protein
MIYIVTALRVAPAALSAALKWKAANMTRKTGRNTDGTFGPGNPGNPGKPKGARHQATLTVAALLDGEAEALTRKAVDMALAGLPVALRSAWSGSRRRRPAMRPKSHRPTRRLNPHQQPAYCR